MLSPIICTPTAWLDEPTAGSTVTFCHKCKRNVWISKSGVEYVAANPLAPVWCTPCVIAMDEEVQVEGFVPGQLEELAEEGISEAQAKRAERRATEFINRQRHGR